MLSSFSAPAGTLIVRVVQAKDLAGEDTFGTNDPYIELWLDEHYKQRTEVLKNNSNPIWDQILTFNIDEGSSKHKLYLKVLDKDLLKSEKIGKAHVDIESVINGSDFDDWINLPGHLHITSHGKVHLIITFSAK